MLQVAASSRRFSNYRHLSFKDGATTSNTWSRRRQCKCIDINNITSKRSLSSSSSTGKVHPFSRFRDGDSNNKRNTVHPYKRLNAIRDHAKNNKNLQDNAHPYKRLNDMRDYTRSNLRKNDTTTNSSSKSPIACALEPYKLLNEEIQHEKNQERDTNRQLFIKETSIHPSQTKISRSLDEKSMESYANLLSKCARVSEKLIHKQTQLPSPPISWLLHKLDNDYKTNDIINEEEYTQRINLYKDFHKLLDVILQEKSFMKQMLVLIDESPSHNVHAKQSLHCLLTNCLILCSSAIPPKYWRIYENDNEDEQQPAKYTNNTALIIDPNIYNTPMENITQLYRLFQKFHLDIQPIHYESIIKTANFDGNNYEFASQLFKKQISIDENGYVPIDSRLGWDKCVEMGLYSIAMNIISAHERGDIEGDGDYLAQKVGEEVMDAVKEMCMVSSTDQEKYILAAGLAIGRAGQFLSLPYYINNHVDEFDKCRQVLIAAAMNACVECEQYELGLQLYNDLANDPSSSEWQWAGGYGVHPLCRDLALQCMGMIDPIASENDSKEKFGLSNAATSLLKEIIEDEGVISQKALISVFNVYKSDRNVDQAIELMHLISSYRECNLNWKVVEENAEYFITNVSSKQNKLPEESNVISDDILLSLVMKICNAAGEFGLTLLLCNLGVHRNSTISGKMFDGKEKSIDNLLHFQPLLYTNEDILAAAMSALCGLHRQDDALFLYKKAMLEKSNIDDSSGSYLKQCLEYANSLGAKQSESWEEAYQHMKRVIFVIRCVDGTKNLMSDEEAHLFSLAVAKMLQTSLIANQPRAGLYLANLAAFFVAKIQGSSTSKSMKQTLQSILGLGTSKNQDSFNDKSTLNIFLSSSDEILSATMESYKEIGQLDDALTIFLTKWESDASMRKSVRSAHFHKYPDRTDRKWIKSCNSALEIMLMQNRFEQANDFFQVILPSYRSKATYLVLARGYSRQGQWDDVARLYNDALETGCLSDELVILTMKGIVNRNIDGKMRLLRSIVDDIALVKEIKPGAWIFNNYWELKRKIGFHHARLLMWWNDPAKTQEEELRIAIQHFETSKKSNTCVDIDAFHCVLKLISERHLKSYEASSMSSEALNSQRLAADTVIDAAITILELNKSSNHTSTIIQTIRALKSIRAEQYAIEFVSKLIDIGQGFLLDEETLNHVEKLLSSSEVFGKIKSTIEIQSNISLDEVNN